MKKLLAKADQYCKKLNKTVKASLEYNEAILYAKFGAYIGIKNCTLIAEKYSAD